MKTLLISALTLGISFLSFASPKDKTLMELTRISTVYEKVRITFKEPMEKVIISILDAEGGQFTRTKYKTKEPVTIPYDLSDLPAGDYQVKIETEEETALYQVKTTEYESMKEKALKKPLMAYGKLKGKSTITLLVVGLEKPGVKVDIYNQHNQKIASEYIDQPEGFSKDYKFRGLDADKAYFHLKDAQGRSKYVYPKQQQK